MEFIKKSTIEKISKICFSDQYINQEEDHLVVFYDEDILENRLKKIRSAFLRHKRVMHTVAVKANPLPTLLNTIVQKGFGLEVASIGEIYLAQKSGAPSEMIVFDSPAKTLKELKYALGNHLRINIDSFSELERIKKMINAGFESKSIIGLRINPQVGTGEIQSTSVAGRYSKFGVPIQLYQEEIIKVFLENSWLTGLHIHIGSQGCDIELILKGIEVVCKLADKINNRLKNHDLDRRIEFIDIGGGLSVSYQPNVDPPDIDEFAKKTEKIFQKYQLSETTLITEFGRFVHVNAGWALSKVEYVKPDKYITTLITHSGADLFIRETLNPNDWYHELSVLNSEGDLNNNLKKYLYNIAGPLCFAGDFLSKNRWLPEVIENDYIVIHDVGGYTFSMWSKYLSRHFPKIISYSSKSSKISIIKKRDSLEDLFNFWK